MSIRIFAFQQSLYVVTPKARQAAPRGEARTGEGPRAEENGLVYTVPQIWVLVIFGKLLRKTFRKRTSLASVSVSATMAPTSPCLQLSAVTSS